jgi:acetoin utilization deacetylase AcuC-like enzyme
MLTFFHPEQLLHHPRSYFSRGQMRTPQEVPERVARLLQACEALAFPVKQPTDAGMAPIAAVHTSEYLAFLEHAHKRWKEVPADWGEEVMSNVFVREPNALRGILAEAAKYLADGSCPVGPSTWRSAYWGAQSAVAAAEAVLGGEHAAYALCRPPGHHARRDAAGGFCYINNAAVAAQVLRRQHGKVVVLDPDMHHGQGVQDIFYDRDDVLYISIHGDPTNFYPAVIGFEDEVGEGQGKGFNLNLPMPHGSPESVFFEKMDRAIAAIKDFGADALVFAIGFDIYRGDPQSMIDFSAEGFGRMGEMIRALNLPTVVVQEGGYDIDTLNDNAQRFFKGFGE